MTLTVWESLAIILICGVCTIFERAFPFLIFRGKEVPKLIRYLGKVLPSAIMITLVIYTLKDIDIATPISIWPKLIALVVTLFLQFWRKNALLSIFCGTVLCMVLTQFVF